jgi:hypothetical protein
MGAGSLRWGSSSSGGACGRRRRQALARRLRLRQMLRALEVELTAAPRLQLLPPPPWNQITGRVPRKRSGAACCCGVALASMVACRARQLRPLSRGPGMQQQLPQRLKRRRSRVRRAVPCRRSARGVSSSSSSSSRGRSSNPCGEFRRSPQEPPAPPPLPRLARGQWTRARPCQCRARPSQCGAFLRASRRPRPLR